MEIDNPRSLLLLDGAVGTNLMMKGMKLDVCPEEWMLNNPEAIKSLQAEFVEAGSDIIYAPTFSCNRERLRLYHHENDVKEYNKKLVAFTKSVSKDKKVAGGLSPTGLIPIPYGETSFDELVEIYNEQASALNEAGVDLFIIETMMSLIEARAAIFACRKYNRPIFVTITVNEKGKTVTGAVALSCLISLQNLGIDAFGMNCSTGPEKIYEIIKEIKPFAMIPLIAKPSAGQPNPLIPNVYDISPVIMADLMKETLDAGADIIGGCCGCTPEHIKKMREVIDHYTKQNNISNSNNSSDIILSNGLEIFALKSDQIEFTEPILCEHDMADKILTAEEESFSVLLIQLISSDDADEFSINSHIAKLPVCFTSDNEEALERGLYLYNGRCMIDSQSAIDKEKLKELAEKYGAFLY